MKPPDRPAPGRTDRILGVMGGMLRACALPGQEEVRKGDFGGVRGFLVVFRRTAPHNYVYPQKEILRGTRRNLRVPLRAIATFWVNFSLQPRRPLYNVDFDSWGKGEVKAGLGGKGSLTIFLSLPRREAP